MLVVLIKTTDNCGRNVCSDQIRVLPNADAGNIYDPWLELYVDQLVKLRMDDYPDAGISAHISVVIKSVYSDDRI